MSAGWTDGTGGLDSFGTTASAPALFARSLTAVGNGHGGYEGDAAEHRIEPLHVGEELQSLHASSKHINSEY